MIQKYAFLIAWFGLMTYASMAPPKNLPDFILFKHFDKVVHFLMYFGLSFLSVPVFLKKNNYKKSFIFSVLITILIGISFEILQMTVTQQRSGDIYDAIANTIGSLAGIAIYQLFVRGKKFEKLVFKI